MSGKDEECLVAREVPAKAEVKDLAGDEVAAILSAKIGDLSLKDEEKPKKKEQSGARQIVNPADFLALQSIRSSAMARKTNTSLKYGKGSASLMQDLLNIPEAEKKKMEEEKEKEEKKAEDSEDKKDEEEKKEEGEKDEKKKDGDEKEEGEEGDEDGTLISRGPVRAARQTVAPHHPYGAPGSRYPTSYGATPTTDIGDYTSYSAFGQGYECGASVWQNQLMDSPDMAGYISSSSTPDTVQSSSAESGYSSASPMTFSSPSYSPADATTAYQGATTNVQRILDDSNGDMPDNVSEFILAYSTMLETELKENMIYCRPPSTDSSCVDSPMSAGSAPHFSPGQPQSGNTGRVSPASVLPISTDRPARQRLRVHIGQDQTEQAMLWMCKCVQGCNVASRTSALVEKKEGETILFWQDKDKDTFLHICLLNLDVAKAYAIIEQQLKQDRKHAEYPPWDLRNRFDESPLFIAVQNRQTLFVDYLLELNADPNVQSNRNQRESALMHASTRGMNDIVKTLVRDPRCKKEIENEERMTALHLAVWNNGIFDEATQTHVDNLDVVRILIEAGADTSRADASGRNVYHMAVQKCDATMLEQLARYIPDDIAVDLANRVDKDGNKPINILEKYTGKIDHQLYQSCFFALLTCNANVERSSPIPGETAK